MRWFKQLLGDSFEKCLPNFLKGIKAVVSKDQLIAIMPRIKDVDEWTEILNEVLSEHGITSKKEVAAFLSQCAHESSQFNTLVENLNYSETALRNVFPNRFNAIEAKEYERQPERIANRIYSNRMGNGDELSGDGWKFRGRGVIQLTGKNNYSKFEEFSKESVLDNPDLVSNSKYLALLSAVWFWKENNLSRFIEIDDFRGLTRAINGGFNGLEDRLSYYERAKKAFDIK